MVNKHCKHFWHEPYMTPNNYDLYFDPEQIPVNIPRENVPNLSIRLQKLISPTKKIHININQSSSTVGESNHFNINTKLKINKSEVKFI